MNCPNCGSSLAQKGKFCPYCGTAIPADVYIKIDNHQDIRNRQEIIDHAKIAEAKAKVKIARAGKTGRSGCATAIIALVAGFVLFCFIIMYFAPVPANDRINRENQQTEIKRLQKLEDEILKDIRNEKYEQALTKTALLRYTLSDWSLEKSWDEKREALIETINSFLDAEDSNKGN